MSQLATSGTTSTFQVPVVDISPYVVDSAPTERAAVAVAIDRACREVGFIQVLGHGIAPEVVFGLGQAMDAFFDQPVDDKRRWIRPAGENRGYTAPKSESLSLSLGVESATRMNDFFEAYNVGRAASDYAGVELIAEHYAENTWPEVHGFEEHVSAYFSEAGRVARTLTRIFGDALGLPTRFFDELADHSIDVPRMNNYALPEGTEVDLDGDLTGMGEHTDFGIVTVLWADQVRGLQVLDRTGGWHDVTPLDGALLVNLGDLTARLTNERWLSTLHRVKPPVVDGTIQRRRSAAFFHDGNADALVGPLPTYVDDDHPALYDAVTVDEHVRAKLAGSRAGVRNLAAVREAARISGSRPRGAAG
ncbi:2-oxoglutarate and iron-dependent oxygenase domain-containing protein [Nocardioides sp.]|uniref:isopenicillin N synthase family dioxygenase n=1 Tax=Nocardioides sp. TaxID=35761 RepID=UPI002637695B|nr:2-oxoglutarate and iron-dependent oxygenase domain-containing protein [Nocardioides sp.]